MCILPSGSLAAMEFSDPETYRSQNQLADINMRGVEHLITNAGSAPRGRDSSLKMQRLWEKIAF